MPFVKNAEYYKYTISNLEAAITQMKLDIEALKSEDAGTYMIEAHESQLDSYEKDLIKVRKQAS